MKFTAKRNGKVMHCIETNDLDIMAQSMLAAYVYSCKNDDLNENYACIFETKSDFEKVYSGLPKKAFTGKNYYSISNNERLLYIHEKDNWDLIPIGYNSQKIINILLNLNWDLDISYDNTNN